MTVLQAAVLGLVQGLTEFLPISSTAHLRIVPALLGWPDPGVAFSAVIQIGTLLAVLAYFRRDIQTIVGAVIRGQPGARLGWMIAVGTVPVVVGGLLFKHHISSTWRSLYVISGALIGLAVVLAIAEWRVRRAAAAGRPGRGVDAAGWGDAIAVGLAQAVALVPGASRSGVTITAGLFRGFDREAAARFSFLLSLPSVFAAGVYELVDQRHSLLAAQDQVVALVLATAIAGIVGYLSIKFLLGYLKSHTTWVFIVYRLALGLLLLVLLATHRLAPL
jgi:undecaprenyl-diphosphatase